ncbi:MAG TPA: PspC domain-containing protein [Actinomycetota bacterium]|jgi:phage shock protein PspC (stress-responsive transcriptional regulator)
MDVHGPGPGAAEPTDGSTEGSSALTTESHPLEPAAPARRPLRRSASDKVIAGVAGGLAETFDVSSLAVRSLFGLAFVVIAFQIWTLLGVAVVAYVLLWIFVPREDIGVSPAGRLTRRFPRIGPAIGVLLLLAGAAAIAAQLDAWLVWPVLLIGGGVLLYRYDAGRGVPRSTQTTAMGPAPPTSPPETSVALPPEPRVPRSPRERSPLGWLGLGVALLVVGIAAILQNLGALEVRLVRYPAIALLILGITMLIGAFAGRARWLVLPALLVAPFLLAASVVTVPLEGGFGNLYERPLSSSAVHGSYQRVAGDIYLDLTELTGTQAAPVVSATTGFGSVSVLVPFDAHVILTERAGAGVVHAGRGVSDTGFEASLATTMEPRHGDGATITLDLETGIGDVWVYRMAPTPKELRALEGAG